MSHAFWLQLRPWKSSQNDAFEELCCQLAHSEDVPKGLMFRRKGTPDSGVECYWIRSDGTEWGWQAKFFVDGITDHRWKQCDKSVKKALEGHPRLTRLYFCIPYDLPDSRQQGKASAEDRWLTHKAKWENWACALGREIQFVLWGSFELTSRLSTNEHRGRQWFWFNGLAMDSAWFLRHVAASNKLAEASDRYTADFNVDLPLLRRFEALARTIEFTRVWNGYSGKLSDALSEIRKHAPTPVVESISVFTIDLATVLARINELPSDLKSDLDFSAVKLAISAAKESLEGAQDEVWRIKRQKSEAFREKHGRHPKEHDLFGDDFITYRLGGFHTILDEIDGFYDSPDAQLASLPVMLLSGEAGQGKTQLLCTIAERRARLERPTILMLGEQFEVGDPWEVILNAHGLATDRDSFLGALNAAGEACGSRSLIIVDAINEGAGITYWNKHFVQIMIHLKDHPYVGFVVSVRDAYERELKGVNGKSCVRVVHRGFDGIVGSATREFFRRYGLAEPNVPLLSPEFENPLLLKLLCRAVSENGGRIDDETFGVTSVFDLVLRHINKRISHQTILDYDESEHLVQQAVSEIANCLAENGHEILDLDVAKTMLNNIYPSNGYSKSLLRHLIAEHVIVRLPTYDEPGLSSEGVRFAYQRLSDHLIVGGILAKNSAVQVPALFSPEGIFGKRMHGGWLYSIAGWLEALAIQLPERYGLEIDQATGVPISERVIFDAFRKSLVWRKTDAFSLEVLQRVEVILRSERGMAFEILDELISVTAKPKHPLNAEWLDRQLHHLSMADRDAFWSIYLFGQVKREGAILRLIEWAWSERPQDHFSDEVVRLAGMTLTWCLTTSDRFVRDRATKSLVSLLTCRLQVLRGLIEHFSDVEEPYLQERLYAVAYGCAMLTKQVTELEALAQNTYDRIFKNGEQPPSVLLRDHARGVIECATRRGILVDHDPVRIVPPYRSSWPAKLPPSLSRLERLYKFDRHENKYQSLRRIYHSVTGDDFAHYVVGDVTKWSRFPKTSRRAASPRKLFKELQASLSRQEAKVLERYAESCRSVDGRSSDQLEQSWNKGHLDVISQVEAYLPAILGGERKAQSFKRNIVPYLKNRYHARYSEHFEIKMFQRLILARVLELGWTVERFGEFDDRAYSVGREARKAERIGKKYQWIAYDEFHARISDNFGLAESETSEMPENEWVRGLWPLDFRDIDPSLLPKDTPKDGWGANHCNWWTPHRYGAWSSTKTSEEWLKFEGDLPSPTDFLDLKGPDGEAWFALRSYAHWKREEEAGKFKGADRESQEMHYIFRSYLVRREHLPEILKWGEKQDWINDRLPSPSGRYRQHLYEHYACPHFDGDLDEEWICELWHDNDLPHPVLETTSEYLCESSTYDCSLDSSVAIALPTRWIAEKMNLKMVGRTGEFYDKKWKIDNF